MSRFIAIANQKGGVGKTTTTVNLAASLARFGQRVLVLDMDPQGNASSGLGVAANAMHRGIYEVLTGSMSVEEAITAQASPGVDLLPSGQRLIGAEVELVSALARERILEKGIQSIRDGYDILLADCPPSLGLLTVNTLTAADTVLIPMQCEYYALEGLTQLLNTIKLIQQALNPRLEIEGILLTMFDARLNLSHEVAGETRKFFPGRVYETVIPRNVRLSEAPSFGKPVLQYDPECAGAQFYLKLAREVLKLPEDAEPIALTDNQEVEVTPAEKVESQQARPSPEVGHTYERPEPVYMEDASEYLEEVVHRSDPAMDRDALEVAEIAARFVEGEPVAVEPEPVAIEPEPVAIEPEAIIEPEPLSQSEVVAIEAEAASEVEPVGPIEVGPAYLETDLASAEIEPAYPPVEAESQGHEAEPEALEEVEEIQPVAQVEPQGEPIASEIEPVVLSTEDLADDVLTLPEDSIVIAEESSVPEPVPVAEENQNCDATAPEPQPHDSETDARYNDLQPMTTQDAHHPQEELVSHD